NVAHLASKGVLERRLVERWGSVGKWYVWSTRAWLGHVLLEFARVWREYVISRERRGWGGKVEGGEGEGEGEGDEEDAARRAEVREWKKSLVNSLAWLPLCVHWSFENGVGVPDRLVGVLSMAASAWGVYDMWSATARVV
ncbi:peroxin-11C, partial [[Emmonsia] crescens]